MNNAVTQSQFQESQTDDFFEQMLSTIPSWPANPHELSSPNSNPNSDPTTNELNSKSDVVSAAFQIGLDDPSMGSEFRHHQQQLNEVAAKSLLGLQQQQQFMRSAGEAMLGLPLSVGNPDSVDGSAFNSQAAAEASVQALYNGLAGSLHANAQSADQQHFHPPPPPSQGVSLGGGPKGGMNQAPPVSASTGGSSGAGAPQRQRVRARRGQATDPHSIAERLRRERIAERMKALQELVPNANKTDKASMLDEIIDYVKFLQLQVKVLSMSRLGGGAPAAPLAAGINSEGGVGQGSNNGNQTTPTNDGMTVAEHQVAKLMEEDMGSAMQYLQGKGLCLMPISLATAISTTTSLARTQSRSHTDYNGIQQDVHSSQHHHSLLPSITSSNVEGDHPTLDSSIKDPSNS
nr:hypothetical protein [Suaeda aralocaspica]